MLKKLSVKTFSLLLALLKLFMKIFIQIVLLLSFLSINKAFAQEKVLLKTFKISGIVKDSADLKILDYTTVLLKKTVDGKNIKSTLTKNNGSFEIELADTGKFTIVVTAIGYRLKTIAIDLKANTNVGIILLSKESKSLAEVSITADKPILKQEIDRLTYDVQADPESKALTALDMMRKVPLLSLDGDENIKLKGSGNYRILINGKPSAMMVRNPKDVLKSMAAADIEKIEVITTPPAKYDSEGLTGLINIITKKRVDNGYNGSLSLRHRFPAGGPGGSGSFTVKQGKLGLSGYLGLSNFDQPETNNINTRNTLTGERATFSQLGTNTSESNYRYLNSELSFEIDSLNLITGEIGLNRGNSNTLLIQNALNLNSSGDILQQYTLNNSSESGWKNSSAALNYQHNFKRNKDQLLTFSYRFEGYGNNQENQLRISNRINYPLTDYDQFNDGETSEQTFQLDYVHPIKKFNIEAGIKGILRDNNSDFRNSGNNPNVQENRFENNQNILGFYNSYQYKLNKWGFKAGVRIEQTKVDANFITSASQVNQDYFNIIPTVSINRNLKNNFSLNLGYTQRIERPGIWQLNPFVDQSNPNFISTGNPDLGPVVSNNFELGFSKFGKGSINVNLSYNFANNTIQNVSILEGNITRSNYFNIGKDRSLGSNINTNYPITKSLNFNLGGNIYYMWIEGFLGNTAYKNEGFQGYFYGSLSYKLSNGFRLNSNYGYNSAWITLQGSSNSWVYSSFSASKDIVKDKITFSTAVNNPFQKFRAWTNESSDPNFTQTSFNNNYYRSFSFNLNYKFGKLKSGIKKNQRNINNNDVKSGGSGTSN